MRMIIYCLILAILTAIAAVSFDHRDNAVMAAACFVSVDVWVAIIFILGAIKEKK
jgi:hypothetical protein